MPAIASVKNRIDFQCGGTRGKVHLFCAQRYNQSGVVILKKLGCSRPTEAMQHEKELCAMFLYLL